MKKIFCFPALELYHCLPLWKTVLFVSSRAFSLSTKISIFLRQAIKLNSVKNHLVVVGVVDMCHTRPVNLHPLFLF